MKKVLITGAGSYIGTTFKAWIKNNSESIVTETLDMKAPSWREKDFRGYDAVFHVAGIAHADVGKVPEEQKALYYKVNTDLPVRRAEKDKTFGSLVYAKEMSEYGEKYQLYELEESIRLTEETA